MKGKIEGRNEGRNVGEERRGGLEGRIAVNAMEGRNGREWNVGRIVRENVGRGLEEEM